MSKLTSNPVDDVCAGTPEADKTVASAAIGPAWWAVWVGLIIIAVVGSGLTRFVRPGASSMPIPVMAMLLCLLAAGFDTATGRIPNALTYTAILFGLAINTLASLEAALSGRDFSHLLGTVGAVEAFEGFALCAGIGIVCLTTAGMGGGDLKLMVAMGAILGFSQVGMVLLWTLAIAVPYALINLALRGKLNAMLRAIGSQVLQIVYLRQFAPVLPPTRSSIPLAVPMLAALFCTRAVPGAILWHWLGA